MNVRYAQLDYFVDSCDVAVFAGQIGGAIPECFLTCVLVPSTVVHAEVVVADPVSALYSTDDRKSPSVRPLAPCLVSTEAQLIANC